MVSHCISRHVLGLLLLGKYFEKQNLRSESGFTLLEVLISILIGTIFVAASLQLIVFFRCFPRQSSGIQ